MTTTENLKEAFAGESQANRKYTAFARKADAEGFKQVAKLFRAAAQAETVHALTHLRVMKGVGSTADNLQTAIAGETCEYQKMYPVFLKEAEVEKNQPAVFTFQNAMAVEETHAKLYAQALEAVKAGKDLPAAPLFVCEVCGHTAVGSAPDICPVCKARKEKFVEVR